MRCSFLVYGKTAEIFDSSHPGHLKSGHDNVSPTIIDAVRTTGADEAAQGFLDNVVPLIKESKRIPVIRAIKDVLRDDDTIRDNCIVGYIDGYEKCNILDSSTFEFHSLLASVFYYAIIEVQNTSCKNEIKEISKDYVTTFERHGEYIFFESVVTDLTTPLKRTLSAGEFLRIFNKVSECNIVKLTNTSSIQIYAADINNYKFRFGSMKSFILDNIGYYINSRSQNEKLKGNAASIGSRALVQFMQAYNRSQETVLGEVLLYMFLEEELNAPKIMTKVEIDTMGGLSKSISDGVHLLALNNGNSMFHQLVFGASNIDGDFKFAVDVAFEKICEIEKRGDNELRFVDNKFDVYNC